MPNDWHDWPLAICLVVNGLLAGLVVTLWFQLWLSRRDANLMRQMSVVTPTAESAPSGGCSGSLLVLALLIVIGLFLLATTRS